MTVLAGGSIGVLLVDDHWSVLWGLNKLIDSAQPRMQVVGTATSGDEALAAARRYRPDVVLLDLDLGETNGLDLLPGLVRDFDAKVLIVTAMRDPELRERAVLQGASGVVNKAEPAEVILKAIEHVSRGELWLDRTTTAKVIAAMSGHGKQKQDDAEDSAIAALTQKEREIIVAVVKHKGAPLKVIADALCLSSHTVRNHLAAIYSKLGVHSRLDLFMYATERGLDKSAA